MSKQTYSRGDLFVFDRDVYLLIQVDDHAQLVNISNGVRRNSGIIPVDMYAITEIELKEIAGSYLPGLRPIKNVVLTYTATETVERTLKL